MREETRQDEMSERERKVKRVGRTLNKENNKREGVVKRQRKAEAETGEPERERDESENLKLTYLHILSTAPSSYQQVKILMAEQQR